MIGGANGSGPQTIARIGRALLAGCAVFCFGQAHADDASFGVGATNILDVFSNVHGGVKVGTRAMDKFDATGTFDGGDDWPGLSAFVDVQWTNANSFSDLVGDMQSVDNIDAPADVRILDAWVAKDFGGMSALKGGIIDLNSEFDVQGPGVLFVDSSHGIGPDFSQSGLNGPSIFPSTGLGLIGSTHLNDQWDIKAGVFEGVPGNPDHPGRTEIKFSSDEGALLVFEAHDQITEQLQVSAGTWFYTGGFDAIDGSLPKKHGNIGVYGMAVAKLYGEPGADDKGLEGWIRGGIANDKINPIDFYLGGGLVYTGIGSRDMDQLGIALAYAHIGGPAHDAALLSGTSLSAETILELTYNFKATDYLMLQPDIQYVMSPSADSTIPNALMVGMRMTVTVQ